MIRTDEELAELLRDYSTEELKREQARRFMVGLAAERGAATCDGWERHSGEGFDTGDSRHAVYVDDDDWIWRDSAGVVRRHYGYGGHGRPRAAYAQRRGRVPLRRRLPGGNPRDDGGRLRRST